MSYSLDAALLLLRVVVGLLMIGHAMQKLTGAFSGDGFAKTAAIFEYIDFKPGRVHVAIAIAIEGICGVLLVLGLLSSFAAAALAGTLVVAASVHWKNGLWGSNGGIELPALLAVVAVGLALAGPGRFSVDHAIGSDAASWMRWIAAFAGPILGMVFIAAKPIMARIGGATVQSFAPQPTPGSPDV